ncbi:hypothetical protein Tco_0846271 [Tanacetum coccineum]
MGFESFLNGNFQIETTPTKLGCWVVENFDPDKCVIKMNDGTGILIIPKMIQDMIGIPMGSIAVTEVPATTTEFPHIVEWRQTYNTYTDARFTIKYVVERLLFDHPLGREFKMNFLLMLFSIIEDCPKLGTGDLEGCALKKLIDMSKNRDLPKGKSEKMKNSPAKDKGDILRYVYTLKVNLEDGLFGDVEGSNKIEAIKQFQKRTDEGICGVS